MATTLSQLLVRCGIVWDGTNTSIPGMTVNGVDLDTSQALIDNIEDEVDLLNARETITKCITFTEAGAGTYTGTVSVPAGYSVSDVVLCNGVVWSAATSAALNIGDATDPDGYWAAINLKTKTALTDFSWKLSATGAGAYATAQKGLPKAYAAAGTITATAVSVGAGTDGRTCIYVTMVKTADSVTAATKA